MPGRDLWADDEVPKTGKSYRSIVTQAAPSHEMLLGDDQAAVPERGPFVSFKTTRCPLHSYATLNGFRTALIIV